MTGKVPQVHRAVVVSAVVDVPHASCTTHSTPKAEENHATKSIINRPKKIVRKRRPLIHSAVMIVDRSHCIR